MEMSERLSRLNEKLLDGLIIRGEYVGLEGKVCLLAALSPEVEEEQAESACPLDVMPPWFAGLTTWIDDSGTDEAWDGVVERYVKLAARWSVLDAAAWNRLYWAIHHDFLMHVEPFVKTSKGIRGVKDALEAVVQDMQGVEMGGSWWSRFRVDHMETPGDIGSFLSAMGRDPGAFATSAMRGLADRMTYFLLRERMQRSGDNSHAAAKQREEADTVIKMILDALEAACVAAEAS